MNSGSLRSIALLPAAREREDTADAMPSLFVQSTARSRRHRLNLQSQPSLPALAFNCLYLPVLIPSFLLVQPGRGQRSKLDGTESMCLALWVELQ
jgi:hypothetical protein